MLIEGADAPVTAQPPLVHLDGGVTAIPGRTTTLHLALADPLAAPATLRLEWTLPAGFGPVAGQTIELTPGAARGVDVALPLAGGRPVRLGEIATCTLRLALTGTGHATALAVPVQLIPALPEGAFARAADFTLAERAQITDLNANVPQREHRNWTGPRTSRRRSGSAARATASRCARWCAMTSTCRTTAPPMPGKAIRCRWGSRSPAAATPGSSPWRGTAPAAPR